MVESAVVVGGGTAGWMTANYLKAAFGDRLAVTLVESPRVATIGVGEATFSTITQFFDYLGLQESEWMPECHATYKLAIKFQNWTGDGRYFYHPFERLRRVDGFTLADWWQARQPRGRFDEDSFVIAALCDAKRSPRHLDGRLFEAPPDAPVPVLGRSTLTEQLTQFPYAYHFDAGLLADYLARIGVARGIRHVRDDVVGASQDERGWIEHIATREHGEIAGDLFVDCTGFRGVLINKLLGEPFISYQESLPNDRAVAFRVPKDPERDGIAPYTQATAMDSGWIWTIPLYGRDGMGYVYASDFCTPEEAERTLRQYAGPRTDGLEANHIAMRIGRTRDSWVANCVAIGLASGFVEPLESTGIFFIQHGIEQLVKNFPDERWDPALRTRYNRLVANCLDGVREFLVLHYYGSRRADTPYWQETKRREVPEGLLARVAEWRSTLPDTENIWPHYHGFEPYSYVAMLLGLAGVQTQPRPAVIRMDNAAAEREFANIHQRTRRLVRELPSHAEYCTLLNGDAKLAHAEPVTIG